MVYIYRKQKGNNIYYYLRASIRKQGKVQTKDIAYLGDDPEQIIEKLKTIPKEYGDKIRKSYKTIQKFLEVDYLLRTVRQQKPKTNDVLKKELTEKVEAIKLHFHKTFGTIDQTTQEEILQNFAIEFAFNTTSLEGNTITLQQAHKLITEQRTPKNKTLREIYDVQNTQKVFTTTYQNVPIAITHDTITEVHRQLMENIDPRVGYRTQEIRVFKSHFDASPAAYVKSDMDILINWYNLQEESLHPVVLASMFHHKFEKIHPFMDGNGRTGRMLMNIILLSKGHPPMMVTKKHRDKYISALGKADKVDLTVTDKENYQQLVQFLAQEYVNNYWNVFL